MSKTILIFYAKNFLFFPLAKAATDPSDHQFDTNETNRNPSNVVHGFYVLEQGNIDSMGIDTKEAIWL